MTFDLASLGWDADFAAAYERFDVSCQRPARVIRVDRGIATVLGSAGADRASLGGAYLVRVSRDPVALPCAGDWAVLRTWPDRRVTLEAVLPRRTQVIRPGANAESRGRVLAANIDVIAVVEPISPSPDFGRIQRLLAFAWDCRAQPVILLTKADLAEDPDLIAAQVAESTPGVDVIAISALTGRNLDLVRSFAGSGNTLCLLGTPGSGKSTLANTLAGTTPIATPHQPRHPTVRAWHAPPSPALIPLPGGGTVLALALLPPPTRPVDHVVNCQLGGVSRH